jgi:adenylyl-sulfate kinase
MDNAKAPYQFKDHTANAEVVWHESSVTKTMRGLAKAQKPVCIWLTGLSGSGKSTIANALEQHLHREGFHTMLLDGDNVRHGLCRDLSMSASDRTENIRRVAEVAKLMTDAGLIVITAFISPFRADRKIARDMFAQGEFIEVFINTPLEVCKLRDPKGLYEKALKGDIRDFTGISSPYEPPITPEIDLNCGSCSAVASLHELFLQLAPHIKHQNN